jgi:uncharacterized membrane protein (DUF2068 family)
MPDQKPRAPTLSGIIVVKLTKGIVFTLLAWAAYALSDNDLPQEFRSVLHWLHFNPERQFFAHLAQQIGKITEANVLWVGAGSLLYGLFSAVEGVGLFCRVTWASWMAIGESALFIPLEIYELSHKFTWTVLIILVLNLVIFWYLLLNRKRLFHRAHLHLHRHHADTQPPSNANPHPPAR